MKKIITNHIKIGDHLNEYTVVFKPNFIEKLFNVQERTEKFKDSFHSLFVNDSAHSLNSYIMENGERTHPNKDYFTISKIDEYRRDNKLYKYIHYTKSKKVK